MVDDRDLGTTCPLPLSDYPSVLLAHGGGGTLMRRLVDEVFAAAFANPDLSTDHDAACLEFRGGSLAFTTDSYVVRPLFFPGGDIGSLAVHGTVNDLAMAGARPLYLSAGFILEEGLPMADLWRIAQSMQATAEAAGVRIVTGDTKVVDHGKGDGVYLNTAGVGTIVADSPPGPDRIQPGDVILLNGDIGRHGMAIMAAREQLGFSGEIVSDLADLSKPVLALLAGGVDVHCLRDLTRGGLASAVCELAQASGYELEIAEQSIPVQPKVRALCEVLGLDPLHVANEGRLIAFVSAGDAQLACNIMHEEGGYPGACAIGQVKEGHRGQVLVHGGLGAMRVLTPLSGEQLPRIC